MYSKILMLHFPGREVEKPVVCHLTKYYDLTFNILKATILPRKEGIMVLELSGSRKNLKNAVAYLEEQGVIVKNASRKSPGTKINASIAAPARRSARPRPCTSAARTCMLNLTKKNALSVNCVFPHV